FVELLLSQKELPEDVWNEFISCVQFSHGKLQETGLTQLSMLWTLGQQEGVWANPVLQGIMSGEELPSQKSTFLRVKQLIKDQQLEKAARLAKTCSESTLCEGKANFKQMYLVCLCLCTTIQQDQLMEELSKVDCHDVLEMICNLESDGDEKGAFTLCSAFLSRQLVQADAYCAWELTLFWSKLLKRLEPSEKAFLDKCCQMSLLSKTVYHILFLIKVIQSEIKEAGLPVCIEMCIRALRMQTEDGNTKATVCKTVTCLLPNDLEVKRACQLTQFLLEPTVDSYYAVETLYNEPDQKLDEDKMAVPNSLRCELLLVFKTQWPFDPEFWDWKTLKRRCLALMGEEASIVSSIDSLNDTDDAEEEDTWIDDGFLESADKKVSGTYELTNQMDKKQKNREMKKLREKGFISARFRNWQVYMQYCVLCDKEFLGHRIIRHAQIHFDHGVYSCPICTQSFNSKETLIPHVTSHVKQSSKDRLTAMKANRKLSNPKTAAPMIASLICKTENEGSKSGGSLGQNFDCIQNSHGRFSEEPSEEVVCPVGTCKKTFKFYRNLIAHVKAHRDDEEAKSYLDLHSNKVVCQYCRRHFVSVNHLNDHLQVHCGTKPYICIQLNCKASFLSNTELLVHRKTHSHFKARCMFSNCGKIFSEAFKLYDHEAKHYKTFTCKFVDCGRVFHTQQQLDLHHNDHTIKKESKEPTLQSGSSLNKTQIILDASTIKETERSPEKYRAETVSVGKPETLESLLKASQTPIRTVDRFEIKTEVQDEVSIDEASPSVNLQEVDIESQQLSPSQQQWFSELQIAFDSLNLIRESPDPVPEPATDRVSSDTLFGSPSKPLVVKLEDCQSSAVPKRFYCVSENCNYVTLSSAAYWRHLNKVHDFGFEQINAVKQKYGHSATFQCQKCPRTFTRNPNLKTHYISAHQLSIEEIEELDLKRKKDKAAMTRLIAVQSTTNKQELQYQKPSDPGGTSVIQSLPSANMHSIALKQTGHTTNGHQRTKFSKPFPNGCQLAIAHLPQTEVSSHVAKRPLTAGKQANRPAAVKTSNDPLKKTDKKPSSSDALSQYKPYRCVHKDCEAAFAIQHNLILHYRAVHQSALSALEVNKEQDQNEADEAVDQEEEEDEPHISEFRCQVKDCSRIFQEVLHLMQHYLRLHEFTIDKVGDLLSVIRLGRFTCGHEGCTVSFTAFWKYVAHIKELHKDIRLSKPENMYKCEIEGCDRAYATKSNMLRHLMKKHNDYYLQRQPKPDDGAKQNSKTPYQLNKTSDGKENIESNKTSPQKDNDSKRTRKINNYWTKYEKPVLKSKVEASAMCTKSYPLQYPCMIKGCESVMNSEKSILKHYTVHGLSEKFLEQHRSHYIFCKKFPRQRNGSVRSDDSKSDQSSDSEPELMGHNGTEETQLEGSKPFLRKRTSPIIPAALLDSLSNDDSSDSSVVIKRKRGRPKRIVEKMVKRKKVSHAPKESESRDECSDSSVVPSEESSEHTTSLAAFKPMGFEMSFLKFLEQTNKTQPSLTCEIPLIGPWVRLSQLSTKETCIKFNNPQNLKSLDKVKIVVDKAFVGVSELMLKQLQNMQPMVLLEKK
uniref:C2H2-type domain-containing protein n=1 Tax=Neogobius melanostomus TaxID=47308 RepID=A0A8C6S8A2_9GOBI